MKKLLYISFFLLFCLGKQVFAQCGTGGNQVKNTVTPCSGSPYSRTSNVQVGNYVLANVIQGIEYRIDSANGNIIIRNADNLSQIVAQGVQTVDFTPNFTGQVRIYNCAYFWGIDVVVLNGGSNTIDNETGTGINQWKEHYYSGENFNRYLGYNNTLKPENFTEEFGAFNNDGCGIDVYSQGQIRIQQRRRNFSVRFLMNSTKKGLYRANFRTDDGARMFVDNNAVFKAWFPQAQGWYRDRYENQLFNLTGNSNLKIEFYERGGGNLIEFQNFTPLIENTISGTQTICQGDTPTQITGDDFTNLPNHYEKVGGTGFQWAYSTTIGGTLTNITGATDQNFTPDISIPPFNTAGTYYVYRKATLKNPRQVIDTNDASPPEYDSNFEQTNISNEVVVTIGSTPNNTNSNGFKGEYLCLGEKTAELTFNSINNSATNGNPFVLPYTIVYKNRVTNIEYTQSITSDPFTFTPGDNPTAVGTYRYELIKITNGNGCERTSDFGKSRADIRIFNPPVCSITGNDSPVCPNTTLTYTAPNGMETYAWTVTGNATISGASNTQTVSIVTGNTNNATFTLKLTIVEKVHRFKTCESVCEKTVTVVDTTNPTFTAPVNFAECVNNIQSASYNTTTNDITPIRPDYYEIPVGSTELNLTNLTDNCCNTSSLTINWNIVGTSYSGTGQPSTYGSIITLELGADKYAPKTYTIKYTVKDCNNNTSDEKTTTIAIKPRPKID